MGYFLQSYASVESSCAHAPLPLASVFAFDGKFPGGGGHLSCQMPRGGDKEIARANAHPQSTLQQFSLITQLSSATLSILMCDFLFQLVSAFVPVPFYSNPRIMQNFLIPHPHDQD